MDAAELVTAQAAGLELLHFDGLTRLHWVYKLLRKADAFAHRGGMAPSPQRDRQIAAVLEAPEAAFALYDRLKNAGPELQAQLAQFGLWVDARFDPASALAAVFPSQCVDMSAQAIDAWLWAEKGELLHRFGLKPTH